MAGQGLLNELQCLSRIDTGYAEGRGLEFALYEAIPGDGVASACRCLTGSSRRGRRHGCSLFLEAKHCADDMICIHVTATCMLLGADLGGIPAQGIPREQHSSNRKSQVQGDPPLWSFNYVPLTAINHDTHIYTPMHVRILMRRVHLRASSARPVQPYSSPCHTQRAPARLPG